MERATKIFRIEERERTRPSSQGSGGFAERINSLPKYVASNMIETAEWSNSSVLSGDLSDEVRDLKDGSGGDVLVYGSASLVHALMPLGVIDEFRLMI